MDTRITRLLYSNSKFHEGQVVGVYGPSHQESEACVNMKRTLSELISAFHAKAAHNPPERGEQGERMRNRALQRALQRLFLHAESKAFFRNGVSLHIGEYSKVPIVFDAQVFDMMLESNCSIKKTTKFFRSIPGVLGNSAH